MQVAAVVIGVVDPSGSRIGQFALAVSPAGVVRVTEMQLSVSGCVLRGHAYLGLKIPEVWY
jgi:hypothetical protein